MSQSKPEALRCAVYTRKSSEEGLEQDFNSLHAQREACEAYIRSQIGEGWRCLKTAYDDGGISGGTMERPGLKQLLADIAAGKVDVVVVYKVDRLTRSLGDFARIVEIFDRHKVSFVSVTQAFNTTTSMGRLTLNVLLSFAQFEREVTGERIRDKIAASKKKGLWMGGNLPLGYDANGRTLEINQEEARQVRSIFISYLQLKSVLKLREELSAHDLRSKARTTKAGHVIGGGPMNRGALFHLLSNPVYIGRIPHKDESYPGLHLPIVTQDIFHKAQEIMAENRRRYAQPSKPKAASPLTGRLFDANGEPMSPTISYGKSGRSYRYYVATGLQRGEGTEADIARIPAPSLESYVLARVGRWADLGEGVSWDRVLAVLVRVEVRQDGAVMTLSAEALRAGKDDFAEVLRAIERRLYDGERAWITEAGDISVSVPMRLVFRGGRSWIEGGHHEVRARPRLDRTLITALRRAHRIVRNANISPLQAADVLASGTGVADAYDRKLAQLAFLAPDIQAAILDGRQPASLSLSALVQPDMPIDWEEQRRRFAF